MKIPAKARWGLYAVAAVLTGAVMWFGSPREDEDLVMPTRASPPTGRSARSAADASAKPGPATHEAIARLKRQVEEAIGHAGVDPFRDGPTAEELEAAAAARAAAVTAQAVAAAQQQHAAAPPPPPPPAAPPYRYLGHWKEQGRTLAYLQSGDRIMEIRGPGPLDGGPWKVVALGDEQVKLQLRKGPLYTLSFDAPGSDAPAPGAAAAAFAAAPGAAATVASAPGPAGAATPAPRAASSATSAQETPSTAAGTEHAAGWEEN